MAARFPRVVGRLGVGRGTASSVAGPVGTRRGNKAIASATFRVNSEGNAETSGERAPTVDELKRSSKTKEIVVDPALLAAIGRAEAPRAVPPFPKPPREVPGSLGVVDGLLGLFRQRHEGIEYSLDGLQRHGEIYCTYMGQPTVVIWDADEIHKILKNEDRAWSAAMGWDVLMFEGIDPRTDNLGTLLSRDFDAHRIARKLVQPAFTMSAIEGYLALVERRLDSTLPGWIARGRVDFKKEARKLLGGIANEIFTGLSDPRQLEIVDRAVFDFWRGIMSVGRNPWLSGVFRRSRAGFAFLHKTFLELVPERRKNGGTDLFSRMCQVVDRDGLDDDAIVRIFLTVLFAAFDTTAAAITSMAYLLAKHPDWQERLREEALRVPVEALDFSTLKSLTQLDWVWKETLRLFPVASFPPRRALREVEVCGHRLAAGTFVAPLVTLGRHPKWWNEPTKFDPLRFSPERAEDKKHSAIYLPFGAGAHACIGMQLASIEAKLFWRKVLSSCRFKLAKEYEARHTFTPLGTVSGNVRLVLEPLASR